MSEEKNYRAYCYFRFPNGPPEEGCRMETGRLTLDDANRLLADMGKLSGYTGGGIDQRVPGVGWTICEDWTECPDEDDHE